MELAITRTNTGGGTLWFSIDGGSTWADVGIVSDSSARVLEATEDTRLYFQPLAGMTQEPIRLWILFQQK